MSALVRVRKDGFEFNVSRNQAEADGLEVLDEPTHVGGRPRGYTRVGGRPPKPRRSIDVLAAEKAIEAPKVPVTELGDDGGGEPADSTDNHTAFEEEI